MTNDNFFHSRNKILCLLQGFLLHDFLHGNIVFFDGFKGIKAVGGINANGISMDKDGRLGRRYCDLKRVGDIVSS